MIDLNGMTPMLEKLKGTFTIARFTVNMAPMLCVLFIGARMRALQMDPKNGNPQKWAQACMFLCTASLYVQAGLVIITPLCFNCTVERPEGSIMESDVVFTGVP